VKVVLFSDLHAHAFTQFATILPNGRNSRFQVILDVLQELTDFCQRRGVDVLIFLGDLFHSRTKIDVDVYSETWTACKKLCEEVKHAYFLVGNHDQWSKVGDTHSLEAFKAFATVIDYPVLERVGDLSFAAHPFTTDIDEWKDFVRLLPNSLDFFFFHQGVSGATIGAFDISIKAEIAVEDLPLATTQYCFGGHYHRRQRFGVENRAGFVGSPVQHSMGERDDPPKGWLYFEDHTKEPAFIPSQTPRFVLYERGPDFLKTIQDPEAPIYRGDYIRVRCFADEVHEIESRFPQVQVEAIQLGEFIENRVDDSVVQSDEKLLAAYIEKQNAEHEGLDPARLLQLGLELLREDS